MSVCAFVCLLIHVAVPSARSLAILAPCAFIGLFIWQCQTPCAHPNAELRKSKTSFLRQLNLAAAQAQALALFSQVFHQFHRLCPFRLLPPAFE